MEYLNLLKNNNLKVTPQRLSVLKILSKKEHLTIDKLYESIKKEYPSISLATVYKNIHVLKESGLVAEIVMPNGKIRYDECIEPHIHLICKTCGSIRDIYCKEKLEEIQKSIEELKNVNLSRVEFSVILNSCENCFK